MKLRTFFAYVFIVIFTSTTVLAHEGTCLPSVATLGAEIDQARIRGDINTEATDRYLERGLTPLKQHGGDLPRPLKIFWPYKNRIMFKYLIKKDPRQKQPRKFIYVRAEYIDESGLTRYAHLIFDRNAALRRNVIRSHFDFRPEQRADGTYIKELQKNSLFNDTYEVWMRNNPFAFKDVTNKPKGALEKREDERARITLENKLDYMIKVLAPTDLQKKNSLIELMSNVYDFFTKLDPTQSPNYGTLDYFRDNSWSNVIAKYRAYLAINKEMYGKTSVSKDIHVVEELIEKYLHKHYDLSFMGKTILWQKHVDEIKLWPVDHDEYGPSIVSWIIPYPDEEKILNREYAGLDVVSTKQLLNYLKNDKQTRKKKSSKTSKAPETVSIKEATQIKMGEPQQMKLDFGVPAPSVQMLKSA